MKNSKKVEDGRYSKVEGNVGRYPIFSGDRYKNGSDSEDSSN